MSAKYHEGDLVMGKDERAEANQLRERQEGALEPQTRDVSRHLNEGSARIFVGTALFYIALPAFLLAVLTLLYSGFHWPPTYPSPIRSNIPRLVFFVWAVFLGSPVEHVVSTLPLE